ncbi:hypothetical protein H9P43_006511 [Blastocladiella emersonii ATCC 22665]|nr:hypothetical protein H9P43_006511 [Blastocladiella emersonii ATCC 22665]
MRIVVHVLSALALFACVSSAAPVLERRQNNNNNNGNNGRNGDIGILNFALQLELLEASFYTEGLRRFPEAEMRRAGVANAGQAFRDLMHLLEHEQAHVKTLDAAIKAMGGKAVSQCEFTFNLLDVKTFLATARVLEKVGVSAYAGALSSVSDKKLQMAAGTIATVEARHASFLNALNNIDPASEAFDVPLAGNQVLAMAAPFIRKCDVDLGIKPLPALELNTVTARPGDKIKIKTEAARGNGLSCNFLFAEKSEIAPITNGECVVPREARGDVYLMVVRGNQAVGADNTNAIVAGPTVFPVDTFALDSCREIHGSRNQVIRVETDVRGYEQRRQNEAGDAERRREENRNRMNEEGRRERELADKAKEQEEKAKREREMADKAKKQADGDKKNAQPPTATASAPSRKMMAKPTATAAPMMHHRS